MTTMLHDTQTAISFSPPERRARLGIHLAPLIDIVFLLNCFFMMATEMIQTQADPRVELPAMSTPVARVESPAELIVNLRADGLLTVNNETMPIDRLGTLLSGQMARAERSGEPFRVVIRADRRQRFSRLDEVLQACQQANISQVVIRAKEGDRP